LNTAATSASVGVKRRRSDAWHLDQASPFFLPLRHSLHLCACACACACAERKHFTKRNQFKKCWC